LDLVRRCLAGAAGAWEDFVRRAKPAVRRGAATALRRFRDPDALDNVEQQVYVELLRDGGRALRGFQGKSDLEGWVAIVAMRTAFRLLSKEKPTGPLPELLPETSQPAPGESAERREFLDRLDVALRRLEPREREILRLSYFDQASYREIAERLGIPVNSVSPTLLRAKERLKEFFDFRYETPPRPPREG
jgi:RNA polymerase sigma-70 factor, ECF subfamily